MPLPKGYQVFPAGYDELEAHVAGMCACVVFTGNPDADDLSFAAFERLFDEEAEKNATVPPSVIAANILTYIERDMSIERVDSTRERVRRLGKDGNNGSVRLQLGPRRDVAPRGSSFDTAA